MLDHLQRIHVVHRHNDPKASAPILNRKGHRSLGHGACRGSCSRTRLIYFSQTLNSFYNHIVQAGQPALVEEEQTLKPVVPKDFELFLNLVEFCKLILPKVHVQQFGKWIYILGREVISKSNSFPLVSGLYKLLSVSFKLADRLDYFQGLDFNHQVRQFCHHSPIPSDSTPPSSLLLPPPPPPLIV